MLSQLTEQLNTISLTPQSTPTVNDALHTPLAALTEPIVGHLLGDFACSWRYTDATAGFRAYQAFPRTSIRGASSAVQGTSE